MSLWERFYPIFREKTHCASRPEHIEELCRRRCPMHNDQSSLATSSGSSEPFDAYVWWIKWTPKIKLLIVSNEEEKSILADGLKRRALASRVSEQVVHPVGRQELARPCGETKPSTKTMMLGWDKEMQTNPMWSTTKWTWSENGAKSWN